MSRYRRYRAHPSGVLSITRSGYGFVKTPEGEFFIPKSGIHGAMDGDTVEIKRVATSDNRSSRNNPISRSSESRGKNAPEATVLRVLQRANELVLGRFEANETFGVVVPEDSRISHDIFIPLGAENGAVEGDLVICRITDYPSRHQPAQGKVEEVLGQEGQKGLDYQVILRTHGLDAEFSAASLQQAKQVQLDIAAASKERGRRDLRDKLIVTIDPTDAKDFDDALSLEYRDGVCVLGVHIADVSHYVPWDSSIDLDARKRGTSVYLPGTVVPMLPFELSDDLCSLRPGEDRLAITVEMCLGNKGELESYQVFPSIIRSSHRFDYDTVQRILEGQEAGAQVCDESTLKLLKDLDSLARKRYRLRIKRGALDFDLPELKVSLDAEGDVDHLEQRESTPATSLVEEAMLLANEAVADYLFSSQQPAIYRVHDDPDEDRIKELLPVMANLGYENLDASEGPRSLQRMIQEAKERKDGGIIISYLLRSMKQARYLDTWTGHFGLASPPYTHFTSPIRRYPDLMVHRLVKHRLFLDGVLEQDQPQSEAMEIQLSLIAEQSSVMEREAEKASREATKLRVCQFMEGHIGRSFAGRVSGLGMQGIYVELDDEGFRGVEGLVPARLMPEPLSFDDVHYTLTGDLTGTSYHLGKLVRVELADVNIPLKRIDFQLV